MLELWGVDMLLLSLQEGDYVMIGDTRVSFEDIDGRRQIIIGIEAPKEVSILRGKLYEENLARLAAEGDKQAQVLYRKLKKEYAARVRKNTVARMRREEQERRMTAQV